MGLGNFLSRIDAAITPREVRVGKALDEVVGLSAEFTVDQVRDAYQEVYEKPVADGWLYRTLDLMEAQRMIVPDFGTTPITYSATDVLSDVIEP